MADFAAVVKELESQNKVLGDIKRNTAKPKKDAGDREVERENALRDGQTNALLSNILGEIKGGGLGKAAKAGGDKKGGFSLGKLGLIAGGIAGLAKAIMGFILNPFGVILKGGKWLLKKGISWSWIGIKALAKIAGDAIWGALKWGWGFTKGLLAKPMTALKVVGQSLLGLAQKASDAIKGGLGKAWGFVTKAGKTVKDLTVDLGKKGISFLKDLGSKAMSGLKGGLQTAWGFAKDKAGRLKDLAVDLGKKGTDFLKNLGTKALTGLKTGLTNAWSTTVELAKTGKNTLLNLAKNASTGISNAVSGLWQGAKDKSGKAITLVQQLAKEGITKASHGVGMLRNFAVSGANSVKTALTGVMGKITGIPAKGAKGAGKAAATIGKTLLSGAKVGAKFLPGVGLAVTGAMALYDGFKAGFETYKETGNFGKAVKDGAGAALSSLTFGLVSKETITAGFDAVGNKYTELTTSVKDKAKEAWTAVEKLIPTKEGMTKAWNEVGKKLAPLKDIVLPKEFSVEAVKTSLSSIGTALNASVKNMTGLDISGILGKLPSITDIRALMPKWLSDPIGWFRDWWSGSRKAVEDELTAQNQRLEAAINQQNQRTETITTEATNQAANMAKDNAVIAEQKRRLAEIEANNTKEQLKALSRGTVRAPVEYQKLKAMEKYKAFGVTDKEDIAHLHRQWKRGAKISDFGSDLQRIIKQNKDKLNKGKKKQSGGSFSGFDPFIAHEGELIMPRQSSGLVLNRAATNAILSAGLNRLATANQGDAQGGGNATFVNAPRVNNSQVNNNTIPIRRSLPIVPSMVS